MSDYISREKVLKLVAESGKFSLMAMIADPEIIPSVDVRENIHGEWISVSERLPKDGELVLCSVADSNHSVVINCFENQSYWRDGKIYAWQPLPEPYKAESEDME